MKYDCIGKNDASLNSTYELVELVFWSTSPTVWLNRGPENNGLAQLWLDRGLENKGLAQLCLDQEYGLAQLANGL